MRGFVPRLLRRFRERTARPRAALSVGDWEIERIVRDNKKMRFVDNNYIFLTRGDFLRASAVCVNSRVTFASRLSASSGCGVSILDPRSSIFDSAALDPQGFKG